MIGATYAILAARTGSAQSPSRSLSPLDRVSADSSPATRRRRLFSRRKPFTPLLIC